MAVDLTAEQRLDAERAVLGAMLIDERVVPEAIGRIDPADILGETDKLIFQAARALFRAAQPVDPITVRNMVGAEYGKYIAELMAVTPTSANWEAYADAMHDQAMLANLREIGAQLREAQTVADCKPMIAALTEYATVGRRVEMWTMTELLKDFSARQNDPTPREYIGYGIPAVDSGTFTERGDVVVIGGAPSDGKTAFALVTAYHMAKTHKVGFFSLETQREKLADRIVASGFRVEFSAIKKRALTEEDWTRIAGKTADVSGRDLTVIHATGMTATEIASISRTRGFEVVYIDYVQLLEPEGSKKATRAEQMAETSRTLHTFAQSAKVTVVELAQLTRQERGVKRERDMFDLGESSQFERDADLILLIYRPPDGRHVNPADPDSEILDPQTTRILRVAKNKEGRWGSWPLYFDGEHQSFCLYSESKGEHYRRINKAIREAGKNVPGQVKFTEIKDGGSDLPF